METKKIATAINLHAEAVADINNVGMRQSQINSKTAFAVYRSYSSPGNKSAFAAKVFAIATNKIAMAMSLQSKASRMLTEAINLHLNSIEQLSGKR